MENTSGCYEQPNRAGASSNLRTLCLSTGAWAMDSEIALGRQHRSAITLLRAGHNSSITTMVEFNKLEIYQTWSPWTVLLSYCVSVTGSYCTIQLMERWRHVHGSKNKRMMLSLSSLALGGCGIWCTHFTGMTALDLRGSDGSTLAIDFELFYTVFSFVVAVLGVFMGLKIASSDPYFLEMETARRNQMLVADLNRIKVSDVLNMNSGPNQIKLVALFSRLWLISVGGAFAALGVLAMHYTGMMAQRTAATMVLNTRWVMLSVCVALTATSAAFWIIFRALIFMPHSETLRLLSALIMSGAVCATHYCGMTAATYIPLADNKSSTDSTSVMVKGAHAASAASHVALISCYWLTIFSVAWKTRKAEEHTNTSPAVHPPRRRDIAEATIENLHETIGGVTMRVQVDYDSVEIRR